MSDLSVRRVAGGFVVYNEKTRKPISDPMKKGQAFSKLRELDAAIKNQPEKKKPTKKPKIYQTENIVKPGYWVKLDGKKATEKRTKGKYKNIPVVE
jgi:hypothetical protein